MIIKISTCKECYRLEDGEYKPCPKYRICVILTRQQRIEYYKDDIEDRLEAKRLVEQYGLS